MENSFLKQFEFSIKHNWDKPALTDFKGATHTYKDVARKIEKLHILFENCGIQRGDKIALCSRNISTFGVSFIATLTFGAVAVPILNEFKPDNIHHLVNHSNARLLFAGDEVWSNLDESAMPHLDGVLRMEDFTLRCSRKERLTEARQKLNQLFGSKYPERFRPEHIHFNEEDPEALAVINYTSGTSSSSKGVMIPYRAMTSNLRFAIDNMGEEPGESIVSMLPMAHMYGLMFEFIYGFAIGRHVFFLSRTPSPKIIADAFAEVRPHLIITVPLVIEKIIRKKVFPKIDKPMMKILLKIPYINKKIYKKIGDSVSMGFGGRFKELIVGGAALNKEVEAFLKKIHLNFCVGYGMTECAPLLAYSSSQKFVSGSCGRPIDRLELRINSEDPQRIVGEILAKGENIMLGYYNNPEATAAAIDKDGWLHTGDLGLMDENKNVFIKGRCKNMILSASGQNIYPEEIEDQINILNYITESLVVDREGKLVALVYPDFEALHNDNISDDTSIEGIIFDEIKELNKSLPSYSQITKIKMYHEEFEKTPKRSIKRFLYQ